MDRHHRIGRVASGLIAAIAIIGAPSAVHAADARPTDATPPGGPGAVATIDGGPTDASAMAPRPGPSATVRSTLDAAGDQATPRVPASWANLGGPDAGLAVTGAELAVTNADDWHAAGVTGAGVKVGIIDTFDLGAWNSAAAAGDLPTQPAGTFCRSNGVACNVWKDQTRHGVGVAEVIHEMAPGAELYLATLGTANDFASAIDYFASQGVTVVNRSQTSEFDGPGDGTGAADAVVDRAVAKGMTFISAAGNAGGTSEWRGSYWRGAWSDPDGDGYLNFSANDEFLGTYCGFWNGLRWSDWGSNRTDYDLYVYNQAGALVGSSERKQQGASPAMPIEGNNNLTCGAPGDLAFLVVRLAATGNGTNGDVLEFLTNNRPVEYPSNPYSTGGPMADSANPGALSVGAIDPPGGTAIAAYSSQGPTNDGRVKPDITAPSCLQSTAYGSDCFNGTSAAAPVVAGAAALVQSSGAATTPRATADYLRRAVVERGAAGPDPVFGSGELRLPAPDPAPFATLAALVDRQFVDYLGRGPSAAERNDWTRRLITGTADRGDLVTALRRSSDNIEHVDPVTRLYSAYFLRIPDRGGLVYWIGKHRRGTRLGTISQSFAGSNEFKRRYGSLSNAQFVELIYRNLFGRTPDPSGLAYWTTQLDRNRKDRGAVMAGFSESNEYKRNQATKVDVSVGVIFMLKRSPTPQEFDALVAKGADPAAVADWCFAAGGYGI